MKRPDTFAGRVGQVLAYLAVIAFIVVVLFFPNGWPFLHLGPWPD